MDAPRARRLAVIDLGSNTARLVIFPAIPGCSSRPVDHVREVVRLRQGMTAEGMSESAIARASSTIRLFKRFCDSTGVDKTLPIATSVVREAAYRSRFAQRVAREIVISLEVLDGERKSYYDAIGTSNEVPLDAGTVVDIGRGSVEISDEYPAVELWQAERNAAELMEDAFRCEVSFDGLTTPFASSEAKPAPSDGLPLNQ